MLDEIDDIRVLDHAQSLNFGVYDSFEELLFIQNLYRKFVSFVVPCDLDLAAGT